MSTQQRNHACLVPVDPSTVDVLRQQTLVVEHDGKTDLQGMILKLLDDGSAPVGLLIEDDGPQVESFEQSSYTLPKLSVMPVDNEDVGASGRMRSWFCFLTRLD